jgi:hypothetical protein
MSKKIVIHSHYVNLLNKVLNELGVKGDDQDKVISNFEVTNLACDINSETEFSMKVNRNAFPIIWENKKGKIFEIIGTNHRNKTTTLIYLATLLGLDWDEYEPFLEDKKIMRQSKSVLAEISNGVSVEFTIENSNYRFELNINNSIANAIWWDKQKAIHIPYDNLSLKSQTDWKEYRNKICHYFDVQMVGVGRNFVTQVGFEESNNLALFCQSVCDYLIGYSQWLSAEKPKFNQAYLRSRINEHKIRAHQLSEQIKDIEIQKNIIAAELIEIDQLYNYIKNIFGNENISNAIAINKKRLKAQKYVNEIQEYSDKKKILSDSINQNDQILIKTNIDLEDLKETVQKVIDALSIIKSSLKLPINIVNEFNDSLASMNITKIISDTDIFLVDSNSKDAHEAIMNSAFSGISLETKILGLYFFTNQIVNLAALKEYMEKARNDSFFLAKIKDPLINLKHQLTRLGYDTSEKFEADISGIEQLKSINQANITELNEINSALEIAKESYQLSLRGFSDFKDLKNACDHAINLCRLDFEKIEDIIDKYNYEVEDDLLEKIMLTKSGLSNKLQTFLDNINSLSRQSNTNKQRRKRFEDILSSIDDENQIEQRINSLVRVKDVYMNIYEYFTAKRKYLENPDPQLIQDYENNQNNLGSYFIEIMSLINERIKTRCPYAFVNTNSGVEKRKIVEFNFLTSEYKVDGLDEMSLYHGGIVSSMTVYGLATKRTGADFGSILLVDEWGDVGIYKNYIFEALKEINHLSLAIFVDVDENKNSTEFIKR